MAVAPAPPRTVAWRGVPRAAISTRWGQRCAAQRHSNATQRLGQGPPLSRRAPPLSLAQWCFARALTTPGDAIRPSFDENPTLVTRLCEVFERGRSDGFRPVVSSSVHLQRNQFCNTAPAPSGHRTPLRAVQNGRRATRIKAAAFGAQKITARAQRTAARARAAAVLASVGGRG